MLRVSEVKKIFHKKKENEVVALNGISFNVNKGEMIAIMGPSGSGKSTLLHIMGCLDRPTEGTYLLDGINVSTLSDRELAKVRNKKIGFILQQFVLIEDETAIENVGVPLMFGNEKFLKIDSQSYKVMKMLGIDHLASKKVKMLSGGEKQRVAIARALVNNPDIILADEPTGSLDSKNTELIMDILVNLNQEGKTIIIITHDSIVAERCGSIYNIVDGKIYDK